MAATGILLGALSPHPPIVVPEIGEENIERCASTRDGLQQLAMLVAEARPDTVVIIAPHGPVLRDAMTLMSSTILEGNFREFGITGTLLRYGNDLRLVNRIVEEAAKRNVNVVTTDPGRQPSFRSPGDLHYAILVPLYYLKQAGYEGRLVAGAAGLVSDESLLNFGRAVQAASKETGVRVAYIASGDLSHSLSEGAPAGYDPMGKVFDQKVVAALSRGDFGALLDIDPELVDRAGQCGLGPILTLAGALDGHEVVPQIYSYEGPFGVGYCVASFTPKGPGAVLADGRARQDAARGSGADKPVRTGASDVVETTETGSAPQAGPPVTRPQAGPPAARAEVAEGEVESPPVEDDAVSDAAATGEAGGAQDEEEAALLSAAEPDDAGSGGEPDEADYGGGRAGGMHPLVRLARLALETYVTTGGLISPPSSSFGLDRRAGAFVSLKERGELRGCIGTIAPTAPSLADEVIRNAVQAGTADPRFDPVKPEELGIIEYSVDVLEPHEPISSLDELDPNVYGVIVSKGRRTGLLLPDLEGVDTPALQVSIALQKAGIAPNETGVSLFRFKVTRYH